MSNIRTKAVRRLAAVAVLGLLAACGPKEPVASAPVGPPKVVVVKAEPIPLRPRAPGDAAPSFIIPGIGADGTRLTVNHGLSSLESVWNYRSGMNVAALNCMDARYQPILENYRSLLTKHGKRLTKVNADLDKQYRTEHGRNATRAREAYMTSVYNYFALPPARSYFCDAALKISMEELQSPPADIDAHAVAALPRLEAAFGTFYHDLEQYRIAAAQWDAKYLPIMYPAEYAARTANMNFGTSGPNSGAVFTNATYGPAPAGTSAPAVSQPVVQPTP